MQSYQTPSTPPYYDYRDEFGRRRSTSGLSGFGGGVAASKSNPNVLSPPPSPGMSRDRTRNSRSSFSHRYRPSTGPPLHMNEEALRKYTDYNADGSSRSPLFKPLSWQSRDGESRGVPRRGVALDGEEWTLPIPDIFGLGIFQMVLKDSMAAASLLRFSREAGYGIDMAYLSKTQEYGAVVDHLESVLYTISTNYTAVTTATPISLPGHVARSLNNDLRYVTGTIIPGLEALFQESRSCVEQRVMKDLYPAFVKHKLALAVLAALASNLPPEVEYPGLGSAFCLTDCQDRDNIKFVSDGLANMLGLTRDEVLDSNIATLHGSTNPEVSLRMQYAMSTGQPCVELVVSRQKDGRAFWNLIYLCPISNSDLATRRFCLHSYINVSDKMRSSADVIRLLGTESLRIDTMSGRSSDSSSRSGRSTGSRSPEPVFASDTDDARPSSKGKERDSSRTSSSRRLWNSFWRSPHATHASDLNSSDTALDHPHIYGFPEPPLPPLCEDNELFSPHPKTNTAYSRLLLLKHQTGVKPKMLVSYASPSALELICPTLTMDAILNKDVFKVLSEQGKSPSVTKTLKFSIRKGVLRSGERSKCEVFLGEGRPRKGSVISLGRTSDVSRRGSAPVNCYWTPLMGAKGVEWVVLVMVPSG